MSMTANDIGERQQRKILVVDDEPAIQQLTARAAARCGYTTLPTKNGAEALHCFETHQAEIALAILDYVLPEMDGTTLAQKLRRQCPHLPILFVSGVDRTTVEEELGELEQTIFLQKPYRIMELIDSMNALLLRSDQPLQ